MKKSEHTEHWCTHSLFYAWIAFSKTLTAVCCMMSVLNVYVCNVVDMSLCPKRSITVFGFTPPSANMVPWVCRRQCEWKRTLPNSWWITLATYLNDSGVKRVPLSFTQRTFCYTSFDCWKKGIDCGQCLLYWKSPRFGEGFRITCFLCRNQITVSRIVHGLIQGMPGVFQ